MMLEQLQAKAFYPAEAPAQTGSGQLLRTYALAALAAHVYPLIATTPTQPEHAFLLEQLQVAGGVTQWLPALRQTLQQPAPDDRWLIGVSGQLALSIEEMLVSALTLAVEEETMIGRVLAYLQQPVGGSRPTVGLLTAAWAPLMLSQYSIPPVHALLTGTAIRSGLLTLLNETAPLPERTLCITQPLCLALRGNDGHWPGATIGLGNTPPIPLPLSSLSEAKRRALSLQGNAARLLILRHSSSIEGRAIAAVMAAALHLRPVFLTPEVAVNGLGVWLQLRQLLPVFVCELAPGERKLLPTIPYYHGPLLVVCGPDGAVELEGEPALTWAIPVPPRAERQALWQQALGNPALAATLAQQHRHSSGRIAHLARLAHYHARLRGAVMPTADDVLSAAWSSEGVGLDALAQPLADPIPDAALVVPANLQRDLATLLLRCQARDALTTGLGVAATARYRPGVRALFVGASGTGKTLAVGWLATRLQLPLYRVDLASITSKYIGETEKNLAQLLARAEQAEVILLFDEADSLFGKRTDVQQANDRFANAQTNYLLQRIESYDGIAILTSNSRSRFDPAFTRRLDAILDFPTPGPEERRALWQAHLGENHQLCAQEFNRLAAASDLTGGHIRNVVFAAAVLANHSERPIQYGDIMAGLHDEYRKLGRQLPVELGEAWVVGV